MEGEPIVNDEELAEWRAHAWDFRDEMSSARIIALIDEIQRLKNQS